MKTKILKAIDTLDNLAFPIIGMIAVYSIISLLLILKDYLNAH
jgi:competence protein ComGC